VSRRLHAYAAGPLRVCCCTYILPSPFIAKIPPFSATRADMDAWDDRRSNAVLPLFPSISLPSTSVVLPLRFDRSSTPTTAVFGTHTHTHTPHCCGRFGTDVCVACSSTFDLHVRVAVHLMRAAWFERTSRWHTPAFPILPFRVPKTRTMYGWCHPLCHAHYAPRPHPLLRLCRYITLACMIAQDALLAARAGCMVSYAFASLPAISYVVRGLHHPTIALLRRF